MYDPYSGSWEHLLSPTEAGEGAGSAGPQHKAHPSCSSLVFSREVAGGLQQCTLPFGFINTEKWCQMDGALQDLPCAPWILNKPGRGFGLDPCLFLKELMRASESSSIHLPYGDKKFWLNTAKCAVIYHSGGGIVSRKNNPPSGLKGEKREKKKGKK